MPVGGSVETDGCAGCRELGEQLAAALARVEQLEASRRLTAGLNQRLEELEAQAHRPAARFRVPESRRKPSKAKPGRKRGHKASYRKPPPSVDEFAQVLLERCPHCGGEVQQVRPVEQIIEDIPPVQVHRLRLITYRGHCQRCGSVCSNHPAQVSSLLKAAMLLHRVREAIPPPDYARYTDNLQQRPTPRQAHLPRRALRSAAQPLHGRLVRDPIQRAHPRVLPAPAGRG